MTDRDRLIDLLYDVEDARIDTIADYLIAKGVIVAPMPMADWLREELTEHVYKRCMEEV